MSTLAPNIDGDTILIARLSGRDRIELVEHADGTIAILLNHRAIEGLHWQANGVEAGTRVFLRMDER